MTYPNVTKCEKGLGCLGNWKNLTRRLFFVVVVVSWFYNVFFLLWPGAKAYLSAVSLDNSGSHCVLWSTWYDRRTCHMTQQFYFSLSCAALLAKSLKASLLRSSVWTCGRPQWRKFHLLLCTVTYLLLLWDLIWHFFFFSKGDEMIWQCFQNIGWKKSPLPCSFCLMDFFFAFNL